MAKPERLTARQHDLLQRVAAREIDGRDPANPSQVAAFYLFPEDRWRGRSLIKRGFVQVEPPFEDDGSPPQFVTTTPAGRRALEEATDD